ncbi:MAG: S-methyl-5'-thioadenosine phosphorylase [Saprospiraceae bacterium]|nr:S-methyl-5'-thioadenosine phosphorylase [Saprospiraceae bacterium]
MKKIGIIGGSGLEKLNIFQDVKEIDVETEFGKPSSTLLTGKIFDKEIAIISRHGRQHTIPPTQVNNRANIMALKKWGCSEIIATTACGSLKEEINRGHLIFPDQFIDFTKHRKLTFFESFEPGKLGHTPMADPFNENLRNCFIQTAEDLKLNYHPKGTVITIEGPRFSTRAESYMFRSWGADIINMSTSPEVILANELEIPYAAIALSTDYDCWKEDEEAVTGEAVLSIFKENVGNVISLLKEIIKKL